jgi:uncharacterized OB-fold protein
MTTTTGYDKPLPVLDALNTPFWEATRRGELALQQCSACGHIRHPINHICPACLSDKYEWKVLSGRGTVHSSIVFHQVYNPVFAKDIPYNVSLVQLEEGPRMMSNVVGVAPSEVKVGDEVDAVFDAVTDDISIPRFRKRQA